MIHPIKNWKIRRELRAEAKMRNLAERIVGNKWFREQIDEVRSDLFCGAEEQMNAARSMVSVAVDNLIKTSKELSAKYDHLEDEIKKIRKMSGDALVKTNKVDELEKNFQGLVRKHEALDAQSKLLKEFCEANDGSVEALAEIVKKNYEDGDKNYTDLKKSVNALSRKQAADNEVAIGKIKVKDLHNIDDLVRAVLSMDKKVSKIESKVDAVYNVNRGAGRLSAVKKVKPSGGGVLK